MLDYHQVWLIQ